MVIHGSLRRLKERVDSLRQQKPICNLNDKLPLFASWYNGLLHFLELINEAVKLVDPIYAKVKFGNYIFSI